MKKYFGFVRKAIATKLFRIINTWAIPCQRSEKKGQRQKVDFFIKCER